MQLVLAADIDESVLGGHGHVPQRRVHPRCVPHGAKEHGPMLLLSLPLPLSLSLSPSLPLPRNSAAPSPVPAMHEGRPVVVHGQPGRDSTCRGVWPAPLLVDRCLRTVKGFECRTDSQWLPSGHPFAASSAHASACRVRLSASIECHQHRGDTHTHTHTHMHTHAYTHTYTHIHTYTHTHAQAQNTNTNIDTHTHTHTYKHKHRHTLSLSRMRRNGCWIHFRCSYAQT
jgi:hypothetical protein